MMGVCTARNM